MEPVLQSRIARTLSPSQKEQLQTLLDTDPQAAEIFKWMLGALSSELLGPADGRAKELLFFFVCGRLLDLPLKECIVASVIWGIPIEQFDPDRSVVRVTSSDLRKRLAKYNTSGVGAQTLKVTLDGLRLVFTTRPSSVLVDVQPQNTYRIHNHIIVTISQEIAVRLNADTGIQASGQECDGDGHITAVAHSLGGRLYTLRVLYFEIRPNIVRLTALLSDSVSGVWSMSIDGTHDDLIRLSGQIADSVREAIQTDVGARLFPLSV